MFSLRLCHHIRYQLISLSFQIFIISSKPLQESINSPSRISMWTPYGFMSSFWHQFSTWVHYQTLESSAWIYLFMLWASRGSIINLYRECSVFLSHQPLNGALHVGLSQPSKSATWIYLQPLLWAACTSLFSQPSMFASFDLSCCTHKFSVFKSTISLRGSIRR